MTSGHRDKVPFNVPEIYYISVDTYLINKFRNKLIIIYYVNVYKIYINKIVYTYEFFNDFLLNNYTFFLKYFI